MTSIRPRSPAHALALAALLGALLLAAPAGADWMPHIKQYWFVPSSPTVDDSVTIVFFGTFPFDCGEIAEVQLADPYHLSFTMRPRAACGDTVRNFTKPILLGPYAEGLHWLHVRERVEFPSAPPVVYRDSLEFLVLGSGGPPPPPPPDDSLAKVMSASRPNPFSGETEFGVSLMEPAEAHVAVYDITGRYVATLFRGTLPAGTSQFTWNGRNEAGDRVPGGIYFYRLRTADREVTRRVVRLGDLQRR